jgi:hypothetical protein
VLAIGHLADRVAQHVFADLGTFMLDRAVKSFIGADEKLVQGALGYPGVEALRVVNSAVRKRPRSLIWKTAARG